ncbi:hypothetical protein TELCIR_19354 [Teladorsagia circumcincta]|uniref:Gamma-glutamylcyclotransferase n=1 Tax=Teladorsagia circumcincta TaxID=45464 RepID=A0A2G9TMK5_TELCI|nr:hypothetical protein TELCIR_19354 [Teladorsagia circumcincta]
MKYKNEISIKGAEYECNGVLKNFKLNFVGSSFSRWHGGIATITEKPGVEVHGCVWRVPDEFAEELDLQESGYHRLNGRVLCCESDFNFHSHQQNCSQLMM